MTAACGRASGEALRLTVAVGDAAGPVVRLAVAPQEVVGWRAIGPDEAAGLADGVALAGAARLGVDVVEADPGTVGAQGVDVCTNEMSNDCRVEV